MIVDDEQLALDYAKRIISRHNEIEVIGSFTDPVACLEAAETEAPHIAFLDIQMPEINGLEVAERLLEKNPNMYIVFLTAYDIFAVEAFELDALDYIIKPLKKDRLEKTINRYHRHVIAYGVKESHKEKVLRLHIGEYLSFESEENKYSPIVWRTAKAQELFVYLLQNHGTYVEKETLMELLWEDKNLESSASLLYTNVYNVRKALKPFGKHFVLKNRLDGYVLELNDVEVDVLDWEQQSYQLPAITPENIAEYEQMVLSFENKYFMKHDYVWLEPKRHILTKLWKSLIEDVVQCYTEHNEFEKAIQLLEKLVEEYTEDEQIYFELMKLYNHIGDIDAIAAKYRSLIQHLRRELDAPPSSEIQDWYKENVIKKLTINVHHINVNEK